MEKREIIARWLGPDYRFVIHGVDVSPTEWTEKWNPSTDITLWPDLLEQIDAEGLWNEFVLELLSENAVGDPNVYELIKVAMMSTPVQLTAALVLTIKGGSDGSK